MKWDWHFKFFKMKQIVLFFPGKIWAERDFDKWSEKWYFLDEDFWHEFFKNSFTVVVIYDIIDNRRRFFLKKVVYGELTEIEEDYYFM